MNKVVHILLNNFCGTPMSEKEKDIINLKDKENSQKKEAYDKSNFTVDILKVVAWPFITLVFLISFWSPLRNTANKIPDIIENANVIKIGELSLEVSRRLGRKASEEVLDIIAKLSEDDIKIVLELSSSLTSPSEKSFQEYENIIKLGLAKSMSTEELAKINSENEINKTGSPNQKKGIIRTSLGAETKDYLQSIVTEFIRETAENSKD